MIKTMPNITVEKMSATGEKFKNAFQDTPATSVCAVCDWDGNDAVQSVYYDCKNYVANIFRFYDKIFIRCMYLFNETVKESYYDVPCETWDATYENLPVTDTLLWEDNNGIVLDSKAEAFSVRKSGEGVLEVYWANKKVIFDENGISLFNIKPEFCIKGSGANIVMNNNEICYEYRGNKYSLTVTRGTVMLCGEIIKMDGRDGHIKLAFKRNV